MKNLSFLKVALVHDDLVQNGGAEKVFFHLTQLFPKADIYSLILSEKWEKRFYKRNIKTSFLQTPFRKFGFYKSLFFLNPIAFESFKFDSYDLVISTSSRFAHLIITKPQTKHIAYVHSPSRQIWDFESYFKNKVLKILLLPFLSYLRVVDYICAQRPDCILANSLNAKKRIQKYWKRESQILYPFIEDNFFKANEETKKEDYFLIVSRLEFWKRIDLAILAVSKLGLKLKIVGSGADEERLKSISNPKSISFLGCVDDDKLISLYSKAKALIIPQEEDFGIISPEAQALGVPVIAFGKGGSLETVQKGKTGDFFYSQSVESLVEVLNKFRVTNYKNADLRENALRFCKKEFDKTIIKFVKKTL